MLLAVAVCWLALAAVLLRASWPRPADRARERFLALRLVTEDQGPRTAPGTGR